MHAIGQGVMKKSTTLKHKGSKIQSWNSTSKETADM